MAQKRDYYILWPRGSEKKTQKATTDYQKGLVFNAEELPEPILLGPEEIVEFKGESRLGLHCGKNIKIAVKIGRKLHISDTGSHILTQLHLDHDTAFDIQETEFLKRLHKVVGDVGVIRKNFDMLDMEALKVDRRTISNIRSVLEKDSKEKVLEGIASMRREEATTLFLILVVKGTEISEGLPLSNDLGDGILSASFNAFNPRQQYGRIRNAFALKDVDVGERFEQIASSQKHGNDVKLARNDADELLNHYAAISKFAKPSKDSYLEEVLKGLRHPDSKVRSLIAATIIFTKIARTAPQLFRLLDDEDKTVKKAAVMALGEIRNENAINPIAKIMAESKDPEVREICVASLGNIGTGKAYLELKKWRKKEADPTIRDDIDGWLRKMEKNLKDSQTP